MGSEVAGEEANVRGLLGAAVAEHGAKTGEPELPGSLSWVCREVPGVDAMNVYDPAEWAAAGAKLRDQATKGDPTASSLPPAWRDVLEVIKKHIGSIDPAKPSGPPMLGAAASGEPGRDNESAPGPICAPDPPDVWGDVRAGAEKKGDVELLLRLNAARPIPYEARRGPRWEGLSFTLVTELQKAVVDFGLRAPYTRKLLQSVLSSYPLYPCDCEVLANLILTPTQYAFWSVLWGQAAQNIAVGYLRHSHEHPVRALGVDALLGRGPFRTAAAQAQLPITVLHDAREAALQAFLRISDPEEPRLSASSLWQGPTEPFSQFIDRLKDVLDKQIDSKEAKEILLKAFAIKYANEDCKTILEPLDNPTVLEMIEACNRVGTISHQCALIVSAVTALHITQQSCFSCGQPGHMKRNCPARQRAQGPGVCPRCQKGRHWASQCRWRFGRDSRPIPGSGNRSAKQWPLHPAWSPEQAPAPQGDRQHQRQ